MNLTTETEKTKQAITGIFDIVSAGYDNPSQRFFTFCADSMVDLLAPKLGSRILDIATGTGAAATAAAQFIGQNGRVHGIDLSENMLQKAQQNIQKMALTNVDLHLMDAENLEFKSDYFDYIMCGFGIFFLPDIPAALKQWHRVLKPGGKIIFSTFGNNAFKPLTERLRDRLLEFNIEIPESTWYRLSDPDECQRVLQQSGFSDIQIKTRQHGYHLASEQDWWEILWNTGYRGLLNQLDAANLAEFRQQHLTELDELKTDDGIWLDIETHFSSAHKPA